jgi:hypothetical protein
VVWRYHARPVTTVAIGHNRKQMVATESDYLACWPATVHLTNEGTLLCHHHHKRRTRGRGACLNMMACRTVNRYT